MRGKTQATKLYLVLALHLIGRESGTSFLVPWRNEVKQNRCNPGFILETHLKLLYQVTAIAGVRDTISHLSLSKRERWLIKW